MVVRVIPLARGRGMGAGRGRGAGLCLHLDGENFAGRVGRPEDKGSAASSDASTDLLPAAPP